MRETKAQFLAMLFVRLERFSDDDPPDSDLLEALMARFYGANKINATDAEKMLSYRLFHIAKRLNSGELLLLNTLYHASVQHVEFEGKSMSFTRWASKIAGLQNHNLVALVIRDQQVLMEEKLISPFLDANSTDINRTVLTENARLSDLGLAFCKNIQTYRVEVKGGTE